MDLGSSDSYVLRFLRFSVLQFYVLRFVVWVDVIHIPFEFIGYLGRVWWFGFL